MNFQLEWDEAVLEKKLNELLSNLSTQIYVIEKLIVNSDSTQLHANSNTVMEYIIMDLYINSDSYQTHVRSNTLMKYLISLQPVIIQMLTLLPQMYTFLPFNEERDLREIALVMMKAVRWVDDPLPTHWEHRYSLIRKCLSLVKTCSVKFSQQQLYDYCDYTSYQFNVIYLSNWEDLKQFNF